jgi:dGTPase
VAKPKSASDPRSDVAKDRDRIVHSSALRRLQRKSQIFGSQTSDFFRTRLTHTLECAQIGRAIALAAPNADWGSVVEDPDDRADLVEAACLAHDLGHPPFGHNGEVALRDELHSRVGRLFEGNAQSFRVVTLLEPKTHGKPARGDDRWVGLNLTRTTLRAMTKYPWAENDDRVDAEHPKFSVYHDPLDEEVWEWVWDGATPARTLATSILDVADDIAYAAHDFEDGVWAGLIPLHDLLGREDALQPLAERLIKDGVFADEDAFQEAFFAMMGTIATSDWAKNPFDRSKHSRSYLKRFCAHQIEGFIRAVTDGDTFAPPTTATGQRLELLKTMARIWMIDRPDLRTKKFAQRQVIHDLFDGYLGDPGMLPSQEDLHEMTAAYLAAGDAPNVAHARYVCDHIAGMTDLYAVGVHDEMYRGSQTLQLIM